MSLPPILTQDNQFYFTPPNALKPVFSIQFEGPYSSNYFLLSQNISTSHLKQFEIAFYHELGAWLALKKASLWFVTGTFSGSFGDMQLPSQFIAMPIDEFNLAKAEHRNAALQNRHQQRHLQQQQHQQQQQQKLRQVAIQPKPAVPHLSSSPQQLMDDIHFDDTLDDNAAGRSPTFGQSDPQRSSFAVMPGGGGNPSVAVVPPPQRVSPLERGKAIGLAQWRKLQQLKADSSLSVSCPFKRAQIPPVDCDSWKNLIAICHIKITTFEQFITAVNYRHNRSNISDPHQSPLHKFPPYLRLFKCVQRYIGHSTAQHDAFFHVILPTMQQCILQLVDNIIHDCNWGDPTTIPILEATQIPNHCSPLDLSPDMMQHASTAQAIARNAVPFGLTFTQAIEELKTCLKLDSSYTTMLQSYYRREATTRFGSFGPSYTDECVEHNSIAPTPFWIGDDSNNSSPVSPLDEARVEQQQQQQQQGQSPFHIHGFSSPQQLRNRLGMFVGVENDISLAHASPGPTLSSHTPSSSPSSSSTTPHPSETHLMPDQCTATSTSTARETGLFFGPGCYKLVLSRRTVAGLLAVGFFGLPANLADDAFMTTQFLQLMLADISDNLRNAKMAAFLSYFTYWHDPAATAPDGKDATESGASTELGDWPPVDSYNAMSGVIEYVYQLPAVNLDWFIDTCLGRARVRNDLFAIWLQSTTSVLTAFRDGITFPPSPDTLDSSTWSRLTCLLQSPAFQEDSPDWSILKKKLPQNTYSVACKHLAGMLQPDTFLPTIVPPGLDSSQALPGTLYQFYTPMPRLLTCSDLSYKTHIYAPSRYDYDAFSTQLFHREMNLEALRLSCCHELSLFVDQWTGPPTSNESDQEEDDDMRSSSSSPSSSPSTTQFSSEPFRTSHYQDPTFDDLPPGLQQKLIKFNELLTCPFPSPSYAPESWTNGHCRWLYGTDAICAFIFMLSTSSKRLPAAVLGNCPDNRLQYTNTCFNQRALLESSHRFLHEMFMRQHTTISPFLHQFMIDQTHFLSLLSQFSPVSQPEVFTQSIVTTAAAQTTQPVGSNKPQEQTYPKQYHHQYHRQQQQQQQQQPHHHQQHQHQHQHHQRQHQQTPAQSSGSRNILEQAGVSIRDRSHNTHSNRHNHHHNNNNNNNNNHHRSPYPAPAPPPMMLSSTFDESFENDTATASQSLPLQDTTLQRAPSLNLPAILADANYRVNLPRSMGIESANIMLSQNALLADFANKRLGGGVLQHGAVQEEIMFLNSSECLLGLLVSPRIADSDAIRIIGVVKHCDIAGYSRDIKFGRSYSIVDNPYIYQFNHDTQHHQADVIATGTDSDYLSNSPSGVETQHCSLHTPKQLRPRPFRRYLYPTYAIQAMDALQFVTQQTSFKHHPLEAEQTSWRFIRRELIKAIVATSSSWTYHHPFPKSAQTYTTRVKFRRMPLFAESNIFPSIHQHTSSPGATSQKPNHVNDDAERDDEPDEEDEDADHIHYTCSLASFQDLDLELQHARRQHSPTTLITGNWGCGAFHGDHQVKLLIQLAACSLSDVAMRYFPYQHAALAHAHTFLRQIWYNGFTVRDLGLIFVAKHWKLCRDNPFGYSIPPPFDDDNEVDDRQPLVDYLHGSAVDDASYTLALQHVVIADCFLRQHHNLSKFVMSLDQLDLLQPVLQHPSYGPAVQQLFAFVRPLIDSQPQSAKHVPIPSTHPTTSQIAPPPGTTTAAPSTTPAPSAFDFNWSTLSPPWPEAQLVQYDLPLSEQLSQSFSVLVSAQQDIISRKLDSLTHFEEQVQVLKDNVAQAISRSHLHGQVKRAFQAYLEALTECHPEAEHDQLCSQLYRERESRITQKLLQCDVEESRLVHYTSLMRKLSPVVAKLLDKEKQEQQHIVVPLSTENRQDDDDDNDDEHSDGAHDVETSPPHQHKRPHFPTAHDDSGAQILVQLPVMSNAQQHSSISSDKQNSDTAGNDTTQDIITTATNNSGQVACSSISEAIQQHSPAEQQSINSLLAQLRRTTDSIAALRTQIAQLQAKAKIVRDKRCKHLAILHQLIDDRQHVVDELHQSIHTYNDALAHSHEDEDDQDEDSEVISWDESHLNRDLENDVRDFNTSSASLKQCIADIDSHIQADIGQRKLFEARLKKKQAVLISTQTFIASSERLKAIVEEILQILQTVTNLFAQRTQICQQLANPILPTMFSILSSFGLISLQSTPAHFYAVCPDWISQFIAMFYACDNARDIASHIKRPLPQFGIHFEFVLFAAQQRHRFVHAALAPAEASRAIITTSGALFGSLDSMSFIQFTTFQFIRSFYQTRLEQFKGVYASSALLDLIEAGTDEGVPAAATNKLLQHLFRLGHTPPPDVEMMDEEDDDNDESNHQDEDDEDDDDDDDDGDDDDADADADADQQDINSCEDDTTVSDNCDANNSAIVENNNVHQSNDHCKKTNEDNDSWTLI